MIDKIVTETIISIRVNQDLFANFFIIFIYFFQLVIIVET